MALKILYCQPSLFFISIFIISWLPSQVISQGTAAISGQQQVSEETADSDPSSPSPATKETEEGQMKLLPPSLVNSPTGRPKHYRNLKTLMRRKKPLYEDFLDVSQKRILESAVKNFGLFYNIFPVKRGSEVDTNSSPEDEAALVRAFELLSGIVGRSVRDAVVCSSDNENSTARKEINCDSADDMVVHYTKDDILDSDGDTLCSPNDPENALSEECQRRKEGRKLNAMRIVRGPSIGFTITVYNTARPGDSVRLPPNGALKDAVDRHLWKAANPTKIIVTLAPFEFLKGPNFLEKMNRKIISALIKKYGKNEPHNIAVVEWPEIYTKQLSITQLATRYLATAEKLARILLRWVRKMRVQLDQIHFIGSSLGAHLAGVIAKITRRKTEDQQVARITGLDPIGWGFDEMDGIGVDAELELSKDDATFVDVIHTSAPDPTFPYIHYGSNEKRGTVDFYPNNGRAQYCGKTDGLCHHFYSVILYAASITGANFNGCKCSSWDDFIIERRCFPCLESAKMGEHVDRGKASGVYYLATA